MTFNVVDLETILKALNSDIRTTQDRLNKYGEKTTVYKRLTERLAHAKYIKEKISYELDLF